MYFARKYDLLDEKTLFLLKTTADFSFFYVFGLHLYDIIKRFLWKRLLFLTRLSRQ